MNIRTTLFITGLLSLVACGTQEAPKRVSSQHKAATTSDATAIKTAEPFNEQQFADMQQQIPTPVAPLPMETVKQDVQASFTASKLAPNNSAAMNNKVQALVAAAQLQDIGAVTKLANDLVKQALALAGLAALPLPIPGFGLVDLAGIQKIVQDLAAAALGADIAGIMKAVNDLIAAIGV